MTRARCPTVVIPFLVGLVIGAFVVYSFSDRVRNPTVIYRNLPSIISPGEGVSSSPATTLAPLPAYAVKLATAKYNEIEDAYYKRLEGVHLKCTPVPHVGRSGDGGWEVCMAPAFKPKPGCVVYSFGVNNIWEFDESMARDYGCTVRAFDPSMASADHTHSPGPVNFYKLGLGGTARKLPKNGWQLYTFDDFMRRFGDSSRVIDLVKIDIEFSEWETFEKMLETGALGRIKQLIFETHTNDLNNVITSKTDYLRYHRILDGIEELGFRRYFRHDNNFGIGPVSSARARSGDPVYQKSAKLRRTCCHEVYYVNMRYAKDQTGLEMVK